MRQGSYWDQKNVWWRRGCGVVVFVVGAGSLVALLYAVSHVIY